MVKIVEVVRVFRIFCGRRVRLSVLCLAALSCLLPGLLPRPGAAAACPLSGDFFPAPEVCPRILIAFFSRAGENPAVGTVEVGNTRLLAQVIAERTCGELMSIEPTTPYPEDYGECAALARRQKDARARPRLLPSAPDVGEYDVIFLGYPIWWGDLPMAVYTFLAAHDMAGKIIIPFCTHEGSGLANTMADIARVCPRADVRRGLAVRGVVARGDPERAAQAVEAWLAELDFWNVLVAKPISR